MELTGNHHFIIWPAGELKGWLRITQLCHQLLITSCLDCRKISFSSYESSACKSLRLVLAIVYMSLGHGFKNYLLHNNSNNNTKLLHKTLLGLESALWRNSVAWSPCYAQGNWGIKRWGDLPEVTQQTSDTAEGRAYICCLFWVGREGRGAKEYS